MGQRVWDVGYVATLLLCGGEPAYGAEAITQIVMNITASASKLVEDLATGYGLVAQAFRNKQFPDLAAFPGDVVQSFMHTGLIGLVLIVGLVPSIRKLTLQTAESVLAIACLILLIGIVLGMPFGE